MATKRKRISFSLTCRECDAGDGFNTRREAIAAGWIDIGYHDGPSWNYLGHCPDCQVAEVEQEAVTLSRAAFNAINPAEKKCHERWPKTVRENTNAKRMLKELQDIGKRLKVARANQDKLTEWRRARNMPLIERVTIG